MPYLFLLSRYRLFCNFSSLCSLKLGCISEEKIRKWKEFPFFILFFARFALTLQAEKVKRFHFVAKSGDFVLL